MHEAALLAARAGALLEREKAAAPVAVPPTMAPMAREIQRVQARLYAVRHGHLLSPEVLRNLAPRRVEGLLKEVRQAGLSEEGPAWALRQRELPPVIKYLSTTLKRELDLDR